MLTWEKKKKKIEASTHLGELYVVVVGVCCLVPFTEAERALGLSDFGGKKEKRGAGRETHTLPVREESKQKDGTECEQENFIT